MRRLLFIIIGLLSLVACKTDKTSVPQGFECFNQPHIYIKKITNTSKKGNAFNTMTLPLQ